MNIGLCAFAYTWICKIQIKVISVKRGSEKVIPQLYHPKNSVRQKFFQITETSGHMTWKWN